MCVAFMPLTASRAAKLHDQPLMTTQTATTDVHETCKCSAYIAVITNDVLLVCRDFRKEMAASLEKSTHI